MANAIPLLEGTDASGGYLVRDTYGETLQNAIQRLSPSLGLSRVDRVVGKRQKYTVYAGRPTAAFVAEGAAKGVTGAEFTELTVNIKKIATIDIPAKAFAKATTSFQLLSASVKSVKACRY